MKLLGFPVEWEKSVGAIVFREDDGVRKYLLLRYPSGHYEFPRGHVEEGETEEMTLRREVEEETGITNIEIYPLRLENRFFYAAGVQESARREREGRGRLVFKRTYVFPARAGGAETKLSHEHTDFVWLPYDAALERVTFENAKRLLRRAETFLSADAGDPKR